MNQMSISIPALRKHEKCLDLREVMKRGMWMPIDHSTARKHSLISILRVSLKVGSKGTLPLATQRTYQIRNAESRFACAGFRDTKRP